MQKIIEIEQHLLFFIDFIRVPKYRVRPIVSLLVTLLSPIRISQVLCNSKKKRASELFSKNENAT